MKCIEIMFAWGVLKWSCFKFLSEMFYNLFNE